MVQSGTGIPCFVGRALEATPLLAMPAPKSTAVPASRSSCTRQTGRRYRLVMNHALGARHGEGELGPRDLGHSASCARTLYLFVCSGGCNSPILLIGSFDHGGINVSKRVLSPQNQTAILRECKRRRMELCQLSLNYCLKPCILCI